MRHQSRAGTLSSWSHRCVHAEYSLGLGLNRNLPVFFHRPISIAGQCVHRAHPCTLTSPLDPTPEPAHTILYPAAPLQPLTPTMIVFLPAPFYFTKSPLSLFQCFISSRTTFYLSSSPSPSLSLLGSVETSRAHRRHRRRIPKGPGGLQFGLGFR